jgi:small subunit ribosomal protein S20
MPAKKIMRHASGRKALRQSLVRKAHNYQVRNRLRTLYTSTVQALKEKNLEKAKSHFLLVQSAWTKAAHRNIIHKNAARHRIARLSSQLAALAKG